MSGLSCNITDTRQLTTVVESQKIPPDTASFTYRELLLQQGQPYYIVLSAKNHAGLIVQTVSKPIVTDIVGPTKGRVVDGTDFVHDITFQGNPNRVEGDV